MKSQNHAKQRFFGMQLARESYPPVERPAQAGIHFYRVVCGENPRLREQIDQENAIAAPFPSVETSGFEITCI